MADAIDTTAGTAGTASDGSGEGGEGSVASFFGDQIEAGLSDLAARSLQVLWPDKVVGCPPVGKYDAVMHARICRGKLFGLSDRAAAAAAGIGYDTLARWRERFPNLKADMEMAAVLSVEHAVMLLRGLMEGKGPTALQSIKFFLKTHAPEFQERQRIEVQVDHKETVRLIREQVYGLPALGEGAFAPSLAGTSLPVVDVAAAPPEAFAPLFAEAGSAVPELPGASAPLLEAEASPRERFDLPGIVGVDAEAAQAVRLLPEKHSPPLQEPRD